VGILPKTVGLVARLDKEAALKLANRIATYLESKGFRVLLEPDLAYRLGGGASVSIREMKTDLVITIGGDGTILRTCLRLPKPEPPILAIDMGVRGFLTEVPPERAIEAIDRYLDGEYNLKRCSKLASFIGDVRLPDALNEIFVTSRSLAKLLHVKVWKDNSLVTDCRVDGVIVASQVGSTGYSLSAGGPILDPELDAFVLTPVCPLTVVKPVVFASNTVLAIELVKPKNATVVIDGHFQTEMSHEKPTITIKRSEYETLFVRFKYDFYHRLKTRLLFVRDEADIE